MDVSTISLATVKSSNIAKIGYDKTREILVVQFHSGKKYAYHGISESVHDELVNAPSIGSFFHKNIKDKYSYEMV